VQRARGDEEGRLLVGVGLHARQLRHGHLLQPAVDPDTPWTREKARWPLAPCFRVTLGHLPKRSDIKLKVIQYYPGYQSLGYFGMYRRCHDQSYTFMARMAIGTHITTLDVMIASAAYRPGGRPRGRSCV
jgi:hypothetical protein